MLLLPGEYICLIKITFTGTGGSHSGWDEKICKMEDRINQAIEQLGRNAKQRTALRVQSLWGTEY